LDLLVYLDLLVQKESEDFLVDLENQDLKELPA